MKEIKAKIEAVLFCIPDGVSTKKLSVTLGIGSLGHIKAALQELQKEYENRGSGLKIIEEKSLWKIKILDEHIDLVKDAAAPELDRAVLETLAYIAYRKGSRQCDVVRVRSNKAYDHIKKLIELGFIESEKSGLTKFLSLTKKFYSYFKLKAGEPLKIDEKPQAPNA